MEAKPDLDLDSQKDGSGCDEVDRTVTGDYDCADVLSDLLSMREIHKSTMFPLSKSGA